MTGGAGSTKGWARGAQFVPRRRCEICGESFYAPPSLMRRGGGRFCSKSCRAVWQVKAGKFGRRTGTRFIYCADLGITFRSQWEVNWARWLEWMKSTGNVIAWAYEPESFALRVHGKAVRYVPDFRVEWNGKVEYHEVKGRMDERSAGKIRAMRRQRRDIPLRVIDAKTYAALAPRFREIVPGWKKYATPGDLSTTGLDRVRRALRAC